MLRDTKVLPQYGHATLPSSGLISRYTFGWSYGDSLPLQDTEVEFVFSISISCIF